MVKPGGFGHEQAVGHTPGGGIPDLGVVAHFFGKYTEQSTSDQVEKLIRDVFQACVTNCH
jgi:hypothetical protein